MASELRIADDLALPIDAVTETFLIFGKRGSGKTTAASVLAEELIGAGLPVCVIDPMGAWWGLRSSADGDGPGLPVTILGGEHADLPLGHEAGASVADLVVSERLPVVLDLFLMSKTQQKRFVTDFMERLFRKNREPLHLVVDEADRFAPQRGGGEDARLLGAYEDIVLRGRKPGIGSTSITLRPAQLHSAIRSQVEVLIAMRLLGKLDVAAIDEWIRLHASDEDARELKASLPSLPVGDGWVWSPGWLEMMRRVHIRRRRTFDSSATPRVGERLVMPREFARLDAAGLERMAALLSPGEPNAEAEPVARKGSRQGDAETARLRAQVGELTRELEQSRNRPPERVEVPVLAPGEIAALEQGIAALRDMAGTLELALSRATIPAPARSAAPQPAPRPIAAPTPRAEAAPPADGTPALSKAQRAILTVLAQFPEGRTKRQLAMLSRYSVNSGGFNGALAGLRKGALIGYGDPMAITDAGREALGEWEPLPSGRDLAEHWLAYLSRAEAAILRLLLASWPDPMSKDEIAASAGYSANSGGFNGAIAKLRTLELISGGSAAMYADETLAGQAAIEAGGGNG